ncbi:MAG: peptidase [Comamonas sp.]
MPQAAPKSLHIFKPGRWTTISGEAIEFSEADLAASARAYNPKLHKAPIVVGHPKTDDPAVGWAKSLTASERGLYITPEKVNPAFAESVQAGSYGTISAKFYRPTDASNPVPGVWYLRHVGFLGAQPPSVKGLEEPEFAEDGDGVCFQEGVEFGEWDAMTSAGLLRNLREWILGRFGADEADKVLPNYEIRALELGAQEEINKTRANESRSLIAVAEGAETAPATDPPPPKESTVTEEEAAQLREQNAALQRQNEDLVRTQADKDAKAKHEANVEFAECLVSEARIPSAQKGQVAALITQLETTPDVEFGEGEEKKPLHQVLRDLLKGLPPSVAFGETATKNRADADQDDAAFAEGADPDRVAQHRRINAYARENGMSYAAAAHAVMRTK